MKIVNKWNLSESSNGNEGESVIYCVELEPDIYVDVKFIKNTGLVYVLQNHDGSAAYKNSTLDDCTVPGYQFDEKAVIALVAVKCKEECEDG